MTTPRPWPNDAIELRNQAAEAAIMGKKALRPILMGERLDAEEKIRRIAQANDELSEVIHLLTLAGAPMRGQI